ncbi:GH3 auxin-responsive promoter-domain-containing protein [Boletus edulis]|nr:GH3 auxin-responsive promoter-domain-containing protein [Boletus edulis]
MATVEANSAEISQQVAALPEKMNLSLLRIIRDNFNTQYASQVASLAEFRGTELDASLLADFRAHPFVDKFNAQPCKEEDVINMFSPGFPDFFALSSATSGSNPKMLPKYNHNARLGIPSRPLLYTDNKDPIAALICTTYRDVKVVKRASGEVVQRILVCIVSGGLLRRSLGLGWHIDDESRMSIAMSGAAAPWAATVIEYVPSFLTIHGLFFLAHRNVCFFCTIFATQFVDLIRCIDEHWDMLVSCIRDGTLPDVQGIDHVREYLQAHFHPNPERAAELLEIGPPFSFKGWFARVWPKADRLVTICSGPFATVLPKVRSILGPNVSIRSSGYGCSEGAFGVPHDVNTLDEFVLQSDDIVEFLDVSLDATHENLSQAWEVEVGKHYEPILTTRDGLWRYRLGDVLHIIGFHPESKSPLFKVAGRRSLIIRFPFTQIIDDQLLVAIQGLTSEDIVRVHEFTTVLDDSALLPAGQTAHVAPQKLLDALAANNSELQPALELGKMRLPTIRIVKAGTFAEYRRWKGERVNVAFRADKAAREWISERVVQEL